MDTPETRVEHLARFMNARDGAESGTVAWDDLDTAGRESYRNDARLYITALQVIDTSLVLFDAPREEAVRHLRSILETFINDRCVLGKEEDEERGWFRDDLRALGVTDAEIEAWT